MNSKPNPHRYPAYERSKAAMSATLRAIVWVFIFPGEWASDRLGVSQSDNRDLVRMLVNSLFWILVAVAGLAIWTSTLPIYN
ncbi:hypothetical protein LHFGNBLO_002568 [Mesorhizobium sp. AR10]|uniref:hypothetical protein n=1 Tax=Mesorhizobium sp. AR10 TaxID=2865839 RepID=UPI00215E5652|nr:hypothetical protein [Mesorhizobium sp. AR10]UVK41023.1 hypothetical protein LHFGNBLO_002568 [Mesorhizobium sp. AR10]